MKMIKNLSLILSIVASITLIAGCGGGKPYSDVVKSTDEMTANYASFEADMDKASNAEEAADALNNFADGMDTLIPKMKVLREKYPELDEKSEDLPENLQAAMDRMEAAMGGMSSVMMKSAKYMQSPEFQKAQQHLMEVFKQMEDM